MMHIISPYHLFNLSVMSTSISLPSLPVPHLTSLPLPDTRKSLNKHSVSYMDKCVSMSLHVIPLDLSDSAGGSQDTLCNDTLDDSHTSDVIDPDWSLLIFVLLCAISVATSVGNGLVLFVLLRNRRLHSPPNLFIGSLACADLLIGAFVMPVASYYFVLNKAHWNLGLTTCQVWLSLDYFATCSSILNLVAMSIDRYLSIAHALQYRQYRTYRNFIIVLIVIWALSSIYTPPILFWHVLFHSGERTIPRDKCDVEFVSETEFKFASLLLSFIVPFITMCVVYWRIFSVIHKRTQTSMKRSSQALVVPSHSEPPKTTPPTPTPTPKNTPSTSHTGGPRPPLPLHPGRRQNQGTKDLSLEPTIPEHQTDIQLQTLSVANNNTVSPSPKPSGSSASVAFNEVVANGRKGSVKQKMSTDSTVSTKNGSAKFEKLRRISCNINIIKRRRSADQQREVKAAKQLAFILLGFAICWLPYMTIYMGFATKAPIFQSEFADTFFTLSVWLGYLNSLINPILYPLCIDSFKKAFRELFRCGDLPPSTPHTPTVAMPNRRRAGVVTPIPAGVVPEMPSPPRRK